MRSTRWLHAVVWASLAMGFGCDSGGGASKKCQAGATESCRCDNGGEGARTCANSTFGPCVCAGKEDGGTDGGRPALGGLKGRVFDADTGRAVDDAELKAQSGATAKSDAKGNFALESDQAPVEVIVSKKSYAVTVRRAPDKGGYMEIFIKDVDKSVDFDTQKGVKVQLDSGSSLDIPPGAVRDAAGKRVMGTVTLALTDVDGAERKNASSLPGDLSADGKDEKGAVVKGRASVRRALEISITDKSGAKLTVGKDDKVVAEFPAKDVDAPAVRSAFTFDDTKGRWVEEGQVKRTVNDKGERVYRKAVKHLSWHAYGDFFSVLTCVRACVEDGDKEPLPGAQVWLVGSSFQGVASAFTGQDGCTFDAVPVRQQVVLVAQRNNGVSKPTAFVAGMSEQNFADNPEQCGKPDTLVIGPATPTGCPFGYEECGAVCTDPATDEANCGKCGTACGGPAGRSQVCTAGTCGCAANTEACGTGATAFCANLKLDSANCGACAQDCNVAMAEGPQQCVDGECVPVPPCDQYENYCGGDCVDTRSNETHCGQCGMACQSGQFCLYGRCQSPDDPFLCTSQSGMAPPCESDAQFCNGIETCDPSSNSADYSGCVRSQPPCGQGATCDEELDTCGPQPQCVATEYQVTGPACLQVAGCLTAAIGPNSPNNNRLAQALNCGAVDRATPVGDLTDELGGPYDCESCLRNDLMICGRRYGCAAQVDAVDCCVQKGKCDDWGCAQELCGQEISALDACLWNQGADARCYDFLIQGTSCASFDTGQ